LLCFFQFHIFVKPIENEIKKNMKNIFSKSLPLAVACIAIASPLFAQSCNPNIPIDGGLSVLLVAGAGYGIKKIKESRKEKDSE
jgi:hypothetical protein